MGKTGWVWRLGSSIRGMMSDRRGVAAIEFAFIAPLLLVLYFVTMEVSQAIETNKKVGRVASMVADLLTQQQSTSATEVDAMLQIGEATLQPYNRTKPTIVVTAIQMSDDPSPTVTVAWSRKLVNGVTSRDAVAGSTTTVPTQLKIRNTFLIRVETQLDYRPVLAWAAGDKQTLGLTAAFDNISMSEKYYLRPRMSQTIPCSTC